MFVFRNPSKADAFGSPLPALVHRDLRPANILVSLDGSRYVLSDFGLSRDEASADPDAEALSCAAPEVLLKRRCGPPADLWSLGVVAYELATGRRPDFLGGRRPRKVFAAGWRPGLGGVRDGEVRSVLERLLAVRPEDRVSAAELEAMLARADGEPPADLPAQLEALREENAGLRRALADRGAEVDGLRRCLDGLTRQIERLHAAVGAEQAAPAGL